MIRRNVTVPASSERVWEALTDPEQMSRWFGGEMSWVLRPGSPLSYHGDDGEVREGRIEDVRPGTRLSFVWWRTDGQDGGDESVSEVTYLLRPVPDGTSLTVQETPLRRSPPRASTEAHSRWSEWDSRLAGAWVGLSTASWSGARS